MTGSWKKEGLNSDGQQFHNKSKTNNTPPHTIEQHPLQKQQNLTG